VATRGRRPDRSKERAPPAWSATQLECWCARRRAARTTRSVSSTRDLHGHRAGQMDRGQWPNPSDGHRFPVAQHLCERRRRPPQCRAERRVSGPTLFDGRRVSGISVAESPASPRITTPAIGMLEVGAAEPTAPQSLV
jgi:hypothetical protein